MKLCRGCGKTLDESCFTKCSRAPDGLDWRCRDCKQEQVQRYTHSKKGKATRKRYYEKHKGEHSGRRRELRKQYAEAHPQEIRARWLLGNAIRRGYIDRPGPGRNWQNQWEFHHPDHKRPYYGAWIAPPEHRLIDLGQRECPECTDYTEQVRARVLADWGLNG